MKSRFDSSKRDSGAIPTSYDKLPAMEYDIELSPALVIYGTSRYFSDFAELKSYAASNRLKIDEMRLVICRPRYFGQLCAKRTFGVSESSDCENGEFLHPEIKEAFDHLNKVIGFRKHVFTWIEGTHRPIFNINK